MPVEELAVSIGFFFMATLVSVYLVRYSNQQLTQCLIALEDKHNELVDLNGKLAKHIFQSHERLKGHLSTAKNSHGKKAA